MITGRNLGLLGVGTVVVLALAFWLGGLRSPGQLAKQHDLLFPQLTDAVDSISGITLTTAGGEIIATLEKREDRWTIAEKDGYHANDAAVRKLLIQLTDAKVLETKTSNPDLYARLGVEDISGEDAGGMQVTLDGAGEPLSVIVGRTAPQANGTFVRRSGDDFSLLVGGHISPSRTPSLWLDKAIMDIAAQRVHQVVIRQPDGETLELIKGVRGQTDQVVLDVPEGRELQSPVSANSIGGTLGGLRLEDVRAGGDVPEDVTVTEFTTFDGLVITIRSWDEDEMAMAVFNVAFDEELAQRFHEPVKETSADGPGDDAADGPGDDAADGPDDDADGPGDDQADGPDDDAADGPDDDQADGPDDDAADGPDDDQADGPGDDQADGPGDDQADGPGDGQADDEESSQAADPEPEDSFAKSRQEADDLQARVAGWIYEIPLFKRSHLNKRMDALLKPLPGETDSEE